MAQTLAPGSDASATSFDLDLAEATFDSVWSRVGNTHYDPGLGGLDWIGVRAEFNPRVQAASSTAELRSILEEMLDRLGESHFTIIPGAVAPVFERSVRLAPQGEGDPGIDVRWIDPSVVVTSVRGGGPGERAGVRTGWVLEAVDEMPVDTLAQWIREAARTGRGDEDMATWLPAGVRDRLRGAEGTMVRLSLRDGSERLRTLSVPRAAPPGESVTFGNLPPLRVETDHRVELLDGEIRVGIIRLTAWFPTVVPAIARAIDELRNTDAIVFDLRGNPGGIGGLVMGVGGHFLDEPLSLGTMRTREATLRFVVNPQRVGPDGRRVEPYAGPLVILVDPLTGSTSEIFAGGLQALGRATVIGETTAGQALPALVVQLPNGDRLMHAVADFIGPDGSRVEGVGVKPDLSVSLDREAFLREEDPVLEEAFRWIRGL